MRKAAQTHAGTVNVRWETKTRQNEPKNAEMDEKNRFPLTVCPLLGLRPRLGRTARASLSAATVTRLIQKL